MTATEILDALRNPMLPMTREQITEAWELLRHKSASLTADAVRSFRFGQRVKFADRTGRQFEGTVVKINHKSVSVNTGTTTWRVTPSLLSVVS